MKNCEGINMYKKNLVMLATVVMMAAFVSACGNGKQEIFESENHEKAWLLRVAANLSKNRIRYNKLRETDELNDELSAAVGFPVNEVEGLPFTVEKEVYISYWGEMAQIEYTGEGETAVFRKGTGTDDVSGDYNVYSSVKEIMVGANPVTLKGENDVFTLAVWTDGNYSYSLDISKGLSEDEWSEMIQLACVNARW